MVLPPPVAKRSCRLIVRNLHFKVKAADLLELFGAFGPVLEINVPTKPAPVEV
jgi:RNA recognition motif-containing protein